MSERRSRRVWTITQTDVFDEIPKVKIKMPPVKIGKDDEFSLREVVPVVLGWAPENSEPVGRQIVAEFFQNKKQPIPPGALKSLETYMPDILGLYGVDQDNGLKTSSQKDVKYSPEEACLKLNVAKRGPLEVARLLIDGNPRISPANGVSEDVIHDLIGNIAERLLDLYPDDSKPKWQKELDEEQKVPQEI